MTYFSPLKPYEHHSQEDSAFGSTQTPSSFASNLQSPCFTDSSSPIPQQNISTNMKTYNEASIYFREYNYESQSQNQTVNIVQLSKSTFQDASNFNGESETTPNKSLLSLALQKGDISKSRQYFETDQHLDELSELNNGQYMLNSLKGTIPAHSPDKKTLNDIIARQTISTSSTSTSCDSFNERTRFNSADYTTFSRSMIRKYSEPVCSKDKWIYKDTQSCFRFERRRKMLVDMTILKSVIEFLTCADLVHFGQLLYEYRSNKQYKKLFKNAIKSLMLKGLDKANQNDYWNSVVDFKRLKNDHPFSFTSNFVKNCSYFRDIQKDLDRTLPDYDRYSTEEGSNSLLRVLVAVSNAAKDVGYIQGLNSIAGTLLFYLNEEESFWMLMYMLEKLGAKDILKEDFARINVLIYQFQMFLDNYIPEISAFIDMNGMTTDYFVTSWFITIYSHCLGLSDTIKAWNLYFLKGKSSIIQVALGIFKKYKERILSMDIDEVGNFLKDVLKQQTEEKNSIFEIGVQFKVTKRLMARLESYYYNGKPKISLSTDESGKIHAKEVVRSLNELNLSDVEDDGNIPSLSKVHPMNQSRNHYNATNKSLVSSIAEDISQTFKKMFNRGQSMKQIDTKLQSSNTTTPKTFVGSLHNLLNFNKAQPQKSKSFKSTGKSLIDINLENQQPFMRKDKFALTVVSSHINHNNLIEPQNIDTPENIRPSSRPTGVDCSNTLQKNFKASISDKLLSRSSVDSPGLIKPSKNLKYDHPASGSYSQSQFKPSYTLNNLPSLKEVIDEKIIETIPIRKSLRTMTERRPAIGEKTSFGSNVNKKQVSFSNKLY